MFVYVCVWVSVCNYECIYIYIYIYICVCVCVCVCVYIYIYIYIYVYISFQNVTQKPCPVGDHSLNTHIIFMKICCDQKNLIIQINYVQATALVYGEEVEFECLLFHCVKSRNETCTGDR